MDDLYKDWKASNSPIIRENVWEWYVTVGDSRLHNNSQQLINFTRWNEDDLIGRIEKLEEVVTVNTWEELEDAIQRDVWIKLNFEAIKTSEPTEIDPREKNEVLWPARNSYKKLMKSKAKDPVKFDALYQGNPLNKKGRLYGKFKTYTEKPNIIMRKSYCDIADTGTDSLLDVVYDIDSAGYCYVVDVYYTDKPAEVTQPGMIKHLDKNDVSLSDIESNNGGRIFALNIKDRVKTGVNVNWFHQGDNKESRCISGTANVMEYILFPDNWFARWPDFYTDVTNFSRVFKSNVHDDVADVLTGITERKHMFTPTNESLFMKY
jgi:predicted phage terminase large subunit-like protein